MTTNFDNNKYVTANFSQLSDSRKIEELVGILTKIVYYNDVDTSEVHQVLEAVAALRQRVN